MESRPPARPDREPGPARTPAGGPEPAKPDLHVFLGEPDEDLIQELEPDQLVAATDVALGKAAVSRPLTVALWALRAFVIAMSLLLVVVFAVQVARGGG